MNLEELRAKLIEWLSMYKTWTKSSKQTWDDYLYVGDRWYQYLGEEPKEYPTHFTNSIHVLLTTSDNVFKIGAFLPEGEKPDYLVCSVTARKWMAGENWHRGMDLPDGDVSKETFDLIMKAILGYEIIAKPKN